MNDFPNQFSDGQVIGGIVAFLICAPFVPFLVEYFIRLWF